MLRIIPADQIKPRAEAIHMTVKELARAAGVDAAAAYRVAMSKGVRFETHQRLSDTLIDCERDLLGYLLTLHHPIGGNNAI